MADNSSSLPNPELVVPDPLPASALIDMSGQIDIATNDLLASPQWLVPIVLQGFGPDYICYAS